MSDPFVIEAPPPRDEERRGAIAEARERHGDRELAAWITGSAYHRREAERAFAWAEFLAGRGVDGREAPRRSR